MSIVIESASVKRKTMGEKANAVERGSSGEMVVMPHETQLALIAEQVDRRQVHERNVARVRLLWSQRVFLFRMLCLGLLISVVIAFLIPSRFTSTARLMPPDSNSSSGFENFAAALSGNGGLSAMATLLGSKDTSDVFVGILSSRTAKDQLIHQFNLQRVYSDRHIEDARKDLEERTVITVDRRSQILTIEVRDRNPQRAAAMVQAYIEELNRLVATLSTSAARRERIFLEGRLKGVSVDLENAEKNFSQFASKNAAINVPEQGRAMVAAAAEIQGELIAAQSELQGLRQIYGDDNVRVRSLSSRVSELRNQLQKLIGSGDASSTGVASSDLMYPSIRALPLLGVSYADLYRQAKVQEAVFETLTKEYEMAKVQEAKEIPTVKVLDLPDVPQKKSFPPRLLFVIFGAGLTTCLGMIVVLGFARWHAIDARDPGKVFAKEILAEIAPPANESGNGSRSANISYRIQKGFGWKNGK